MKKAILSILLIIAGLAVLPAQELRHNAAYPADPAFTPVADSLRGTILEGEFNDSKIYPLTKRSYKVYVPVQYDGSAPACLLVGMDGILFQATTVMDYLIAHGEMPVTIGVFVTPGTTYDENGEVVRYNRSNEFDRMDGRFAAFLETELLPLAESLTLPDGRPVRISHDANDRAIMGASSSGIAAFTAAWERPDLFSRVYSSVGTFVAMRGGNDYPALVRKYEPKKLRIFLQDGMKDTWNPLFGEWWQYNLMMESALNFAGYEVIAHWDNGGHSVYHGTQMFPDAMRWLWKGWPAQISVGQSLNDMLVSLLGKDDNRCPDWKLVDNVPKDVSRRLSRPQLSAEYPSGKFVVKAAEGSAWLWSFVVKPDGSLAAGEEFYWLHNTDNVIPEGGVAKDMVFDTDGNLFVATPAGVQVCDQNGRVRAILAPPGAKAVDALAFIGHTLYIKTPSGEVYSRELLHSGYSPSQGKINPKSQGQG